MKVLALDLSTSTGWALLESSLKTPQSITLLKYGSIKASPSKELYPDNYIERAQYIAKQILPIYLIYLPQYVVIEDTNKGQQRFTQKLLEFIHFAVFEAFWRYAKIHPYYINSSEWRRVLGIRLTKEQKLSNRQKKNTKVTLKHVAIQKVNSDFNLQLKQKDNDIADAILLGQAFLEGAKVSDGIVKKKGVSTDAN